MSLKRLLAVSTAVSIAAGCSSGDINVAPATNVSGSNNTTINGSTGTGNEVCASYVNTAGQKIEGVYDGTNCTYSPSFVDAGNNLLVDMTIPALPNGGAHIFQGSLFVGQTYNDDVSMAAAGITKGGDGPKLTIEAGATLAWQSSANFLVINRGSQIFAVGRADAPITFTSVSDINGTVGPEDVQQWGGIVINGFGITNQCAYTDTNADGDPNVVTEADLTTTDCHVDAEGAAGLDESQYGGDNNDDSSGRLEYVVVKHPGATVGNGDELNGISFGAVGRNTIVKNIEMYSTYDDGVEMFGGAVNIENYVAVYARDDSIDIDEGYSGTFTNALVIQSANDGNNCIESDGIADFSNLTSTEVEAVIALGINSRPTINNLTCIISPNPTGTHDPGAGWRFREGIFPTVNDSMIIGSFEADSTPTAAGGSADNYCLRIDNRSQQAAIEGDLILNHIIIACEEGVHSSTPFAFDGVTTEASFAAAQGVQFATIPTGTAVNATAAADPGLQLLEGTQPVYSIDWATSQVDGAAPIASTDPAPRLFLGGLSMSIPDWTAGWTYGIDPANRGEPLWFE